MGDKPKSIQEKVTIRPTPLGARVIRRLGIPNMDKSGELRRLIELGLAAELAGFSLDGSVLRVGGRVWDLRHELDQGDVAGGAPSLRSPADAGGADGGGDAQPAQSAVPAISPPTPLVAETQSETVPEVGQKAATSGPAGSPLLANLRNLSGGG